MLRITHTRGRSAPRVEHLAARRLRAGSAPGCELLFGPQEGRGVAAVHAELREDGGVVRVVDMGSPQGTWVNGARVREQPLGRGDRVALGVPDGPEFCVELLAQPEADGRVDLATAERMVADAVRKATAGEDRTVAVVSSKVAAVKKRSARTNLLLSLGIGGVFVAMGVTAASILRSHRAADSLGTDMGIDRTSKPPKGTIPTRVYTGREIYEENKAALYLLGWLSGNRVGGVCTAFAIQPTLLATNAHCVSAYQTKGGTPVVTQNDSAGRVRFKIMSASKHPAYRVSRASADTPDVGLLRIDGTMPRTVTIANEAELSALGTGDDIYVLGFPGRVMDPLSPSATFLKGNVGRLLALGERATEDHTKAVLIQHDAVTRGGNSGSPIFNQYGHVVGVHAAHLDEEREVRVGGKATTVVDSSPFRIGMRIDLINGVRAP